MSHTRFRCAGLGQHGAFLQLHSSNETNPKVLILVSGWSYADDTILIHGTILSSYRCQPAPSQAGSSFNLQSVYAMLLHFRFNLHQAQGSITMPSYFSTAWNILSFDSTIFPHKLYLSGFCRISAASTSPQLSSSIAARAMSPCMVMGCFQVGESSTRHWLMNASLNCKRSPSCRRVRLRSNCARPRLFPSRAEFFALHLSKQSTQGMLPSQVGR